MTVGTSLAQSTQWLLDYPAGLVSGIATTINSRAASAMADGVRNPAP
jgi:hypothetical protein